MISLCDRSRRPVRYANQLPGQVEQAIVQARKDKPSWGARKIRELTQANCATCNLESARPDRIKVSALFVQAIPRG